MAVKDYEGNGIVVHWDAAACSHSGRCVAGAPEVFDTARRPWVTATARTADDIAAVIDTCPSDGAPHGRRGHGADEDPATARRPDDEVTSSPTDQQSGVTTVRMRRDGPLVVEGRLVLIAAEGEAETHDRLFLCRCGHSADKPRCDGSHKRIGFSAPGEVPTSRS
jgi:uncharacterized Fe-S cluster protein YjdI/CDGSH-type Zn-finger protein